MRVWETIDGKSKSTIYTLFTFFVSAPHMRMLCMSGAMAAAEFRYSVVGLYFDSMHGIFLEFTKARIWGTFR